MQLTTTFRGLNESESALASKSLEKGMGRLERLVEKPVPLRAVVESGSPHRVLLSFSADGEDLNAESTDHDLALAISAACEKMRKQLVKTRRRRQASRHTNGVSIH